MKNESHLAYITFDKISFFNIMLISDLHSVEYKANELENELIFDRDNLEKLKFCIDVCDWKVPELAAKIQRAGENKFGW